MTRTKSPDLAAFRVRIRDKWRHREQALRSFRDVMPWLPRRPLGHGRIKEHLYTLMPEPLLEGEEIQAWDKLSAESDLIVFFDDPREDIYRFSKASDFVNKMPMGSWYASAGSGELYVQLEISGEFKVRRVSQESLRTKREIFEQVRTRTPEFVTSIYSKQDALAFLRKKEFFRCSELDVLMERRLRRKIRSRITAKGLYLPSYSLPQTLLNFDPLFSYLPDALDINNVRRTLTWLSSTSTNWLLFFEKRDTGLYSVSSFSSLKGFRAETIYIVDSLDLNWMIVIPREYLCLGASAHFSCQFLSM